MKFHTIHCLSRAEDPQERVRIKQINRCFIAFYCVGKRDGWVHPNKTLFLFPHKYQAH
jgi:hypothetical protein